MKRNTEELLNQLQADLADLDKQEKWSYLGYYTTIMPEPTLKDFEQAKMQPLQDCPSKTRFMITTAPREDRKIVIGSVNSTSRGDRNSKQMNSLNQKRVETERKFRISVCGCSNAYAMQIIVAVWWYLLDDQNRIQFLNNTDLQHRVLYWLQEAGLMDQLTPQRRAAVEQMQQRIFKIINDKTV